MIFSEPKHNVPKDDSNALPLQKQLPYNKDPICVLPAITALNIVRVPLHPTQGTPEIGTIGLEEVRREWQEGIIDPFLCL